MVRASWGSGFGWLRLQELWIWELFFPSAYIWGLGVCGLGAWDFKPQHCMAMSRSPGPRRSLCSQLSTQFQKLLPVLSFCEILGGQCLRFYWLWWIHRNEARRGKLVIQKFSVRSRHLNAGCFKSCEREKERERERESESERVPWSVHFGWISQ